MPIEIAQYLHRISHTPPHVLARLAVRMVARNLRRVCERRKAHRTYSYGPCLPGDSHGPSRRIRPISGDVLRSLRDAVLIAADHAVEHRFDLLGSGPIVVAHGVSAAGLDGYRYDSGGGVVSDGDGAWLTGRISSANLPISRVLWRLVDPPYRPIDWQVDFKSGFRWSESLWHRDIRYGEIPGVDVKVPWELGRMHHLPHLALAYAATGDERYPKEFRNQILDFLACNPPGFGVQWACPMDVSIRTINWLIAFDLFRAHGQSFDDDFVAALTAGTRDHGRHVFAHLEWDDTLRGNHFLCDLVGLLFCGAYLPTEPETDAWLAYGVNGLVHEVESQFNADGSNFEASTSYHRLSLEAAIFATALIEGLDHEWLTAAIRRGRARAATAPGGSAVGVTTDGIFSFPAPYRRRLAAAAGFAEAIVRPDGRASQFGDNDSGRLIKLNPKITECDGDHRHLTDAIGGLFSDFREGPPGIDGAAINALRGDAPRWSEAIGAGTTRSFPDFGLFIYRTARLWLAVRCGSNGQNGFGGHAHNDQLSFELVVDSLPVVVDTGTWLYTPLPEWRHRFRSAAFHNTLGIDDLDQNEAVGPGVFRMTDRAHATVLAQDDRTFTGCHYGYGLPHTRRISVADEGIAVEDKCLAAGTKNIRLHLHPDVRVESHSWGLRILHKGISMRVSANVGMWRSEPAWFSPGYGRRHETRVLVLPLTGDNVQWSITIDS